MIIDVRQAAELYADAWNNLDLKPLFSQLAENCRYTSQRVLEELETKDRIVAHLSRKVELIMESGEYVLARVARLKRGASLHPSPGTPCVAMYQGESTEIACVVFIEVDDGLIKGIDLCLPQLYQVILNGDP